MKGNGVRFKSPIPVALYYGGKRHYSPVVWERLGVVDRYLEPFFGSGAILLANPSPAKMEVVCDTCGFICNFWRSIQRDPEQTAYYANYPTIHHDLTARHTWLRNWYVKHGKLVQDPEFYDCKVAGWWVWGMSIWIGGEFCNIQYDRMPAIGVMAGGKGISKQRNVDKRPEIKDSSVGRGVSVQRNLADSVPYINNEGGGQGVSKQSSTVSGGKERRPNILSSGAGAGISKQTQVGRRPHIDPRGFGSGVAKQHSLDGRPKIPNKSNTSHRLANEHLEGITNWFYELSDRLQNVIVLNRSWESAVTPTVLADTESCRNIVRGIFLDPPYMTERRKWGLYQSDRDGLSDDVARAAFTWAVNHGNRPDFRIAYCCHEGDFEVPDGWSVEAREFSGIRKAENRGKRDIIMFSPACNAMTQQAELMLA